MKIKAKQLLSILPVEEKIIYNQCMKDAKKLKDGAKCLVSLMNIRDRMKLTDKKLYNNIKDNVRHSKKEKLENDINKKNIKFKLKKINIKMNKRNKDTNNKNIFFKKNFEMINTIIKRPKRDLSKSEKNNLNLPDHLVNIARLERYQKMCDYVKKYFDRINTENTKTLRQYSNPFIIKEISNGEDGNIMINDTLESIINFLNEFITKSKKFSFFSPKLFNIIPSCEVGKCKNSKKFLSPTLLSFHEKDGFFSLPSLIKSLLSNSFEVNYWLNFLLEFTGGGKKLSTILNEMEPKIKEMEEIIYPNVVKIEEMEQRNKKIYKTFDKKQYNEINNQGYTFLTPEQISLTYLSNELPSFYYNSLIQMSREDHEKRLEKNLKELALNDITFDDKSVYNSKNDYLLKKFKRATVNNNSDPLDDYAGHHRHGFFNVFKPSVFLNVVGAPVVFEALVLSPHAFIGEILNPEFGIVSILSPRAFVATILSPNALYSRILQPGFFRTEILTPRAINSWVLSPDIFIAEILSPKFLEAKILSPELFVIKVLSPRILSANVASSENFGVLVLSPSILSPTIHGKNNMLVEVLSPHLLSGSHESEENEHNTTEEVNNTTMKV
uniref:BPI2 domain-containing protein n=2 Tax=Strongyloides stercoralis TaxID=6248 RepID=A0A0K0EFL3_STRER